MTRGPVRRADEHVHTEYWTADAHHRFEDRVSKELHELRSDVAALTSRLTYLLGALAIIAFMLPIIAPFVRAILGLDAPSGQ